MSHSHFAIQACAFRLLYPVRYALTHEKNNSMSSYPLLKKRGGMVSGKAPGCPWDFQYTLRALRNGHIYMYHDGEWLSFPVPEGKTTQDSPFCIKVSATWTQVHLAYSELPWSSEYLDYLKANPDVMARRMQRVKLQGAPEANEHTADIADYSMLVEEYRERPGCLKSLRDFLPDVFDPLDLTYSGDAEKFAKEVGRRWRCSASPFGEWDTASPLEAVPEEMRYAKQLPPQNYKPYQNRSFPKPAVWALEPEQKREAPRHPLLVALEDPLGEARDLAMVHQCNLEDYETYVGYYHYTILLANLFEGLHVRNQKIVYTSNGIGESPLYIELPAPADERSSLSSHRVDYGTLVNILDDHVPGHPWARFMEIYNREVDEIKSAVAAYVEKWCEWLCGEGPGALLSMREDFSTEPGQEDAPFKAPCEAITAATIARMGYTEKGFKHIKNLFETHNWYSFYKSSLLTTHVITKHTETLIDVLCKTATFFIINGIDEELIRQKNAIKDVIIRKTGQPPALEAATGLGRQLFSDADKMTPQEIVPYLTDMDIRFDTPDTDMAQVFLPESPFEARLDTQKIIGYTTKFLEIKREDLLAVTSRMHLPEKNVRFLLNGVQVAYDLYKSGDALTKLLSGKERDPLKKIQGLGQATASLLGLSITVVSIRDFRMQNTSGKLLNLLKVFSYSTLLFNSLLNIVEDLRDKNFQAAALSAILALCCLISIPSATFPPAFIIFVLSSLIEYWREQVVKQKKLTSYLESCFWKKRKLTVFSYDMLLSENLDNDLIFLVTEKEVAFFEQMLMHPLELSVKNWPVSGDTVDTHLIFIIKYFPQLIASDSIKIKIEERWSCEKDFFPPAANPKHCIRYAIGKEQTPSKIGIFLHVPALMAAHEERYHSRQSYEALLRKYSPLSRPQAMNDLQFHIRMTVEYQTIMSSAVRTVSREWSYKYLLYTPEGIHMEETMKYLVKLL